jgi:hypothetical protein
MLVTREQVPAARVVAAVLRLKSIVLAEEVSAAAHTLWRFLQKANINRNQPRVPAGVSEGGQWAKPGVVPSQRPPSFDDVIGHIPIHIPGIEEGEPRPPVPAERPSLARLRWPVIKQLARWAFKVSPAGRIGNVVEVGSWVYEYAPYVLAYLDPPKSLAELQGPAGRPRKGYDVHHIVERSAAKEPGFPSWKIETPENLVSIPTLKHWELNSWYERENPAYGDLTPRQYLKGKGWKERFAVGEEGLRAVEVLTP